ncbi:MAG: hypothetical protein HZA00_13630 [Nitrospinae bacterium]|nr:hypothetical protein [Nitrospinota bacterium]
MKRKKGKADKNMPLKDSIKGAIAQPQSEVRGSRQHHILSISLILLISIAIYSNTLKNGFVYDDEVTVVNNTLIKNLDNLPKLFSRTDYFATSGEMSYRPVVTLTYFIDYAIYGLKPYGYHLTNLLLHAMNGVLLYIFLTLCIAQSSKLEAQSNYFQLSTFSLQPSAFSLQPSAFFQPLSLPPILS